MGRFSVCLFLRPYVPPWAIQLGLRPSQPGLRPSQPGLAGWPRGECTYGRTNGRKISPFYRTLSPVRAADQKVRDEWGIVFKSKFNSNFMHSFIWNGISEGWFSNKDSISKRKICIWRWGMKKVRDVLQDFLNKTYFIRCDGWKGEGWMSFTFKDTQ